MEFPQDHPYILSILPRLPLKDRGFNPGMDAPASVGLPLGFHEMPVDQALERNPRAKNLSRDNKNIRSCLVNALLVKHMREGPYKQMEFILFREDLMDLLPEHVQALADFSLDKLSQFIDTDKCYTKEDYMKVATKSAFNEYFERAKENYGWADEVISPYEIGGGIGNTNLPKIECKCGKCKQSGIGTFENFLTRVENGVLHLYAPY
jgi:hypothetical protein